RQVPVEREFRSLRVERLAVVELDVRTQLDQHLLAVLRRLVRERQLRHHVQLLVDVEQLVAERGKDNAADIGARKGRIEDVRVFRKADAQRGLRRRAGGGNEQRGRDAEDGAELHRSGLFKSSVHSFPSNTARQLIFRRRTTVLVRCNV